MHETIVKNREKGCDFIGTFNLGNNINFLMVFLEGVISFFSPCVIPLIPLYMSYLAGEVQNGSSKLKNRNKIMLHTFFFVLGISTTFFILGLGFSSLGNVIREQGRTFSIVSGIIIILLGLKQLGVLKFSLLDRNFGVSKGIGEKKMNPIMAFIMGFGFSFAWTPCVGPALASVLLMASNASSSSVGNIYILLYSLGFLIPFLILGIFTNETLSFIKGRQSDLNKIVKVGGIILVIMGVLLILGKFEKFGALFNDQTQQESSVDDRASSSNKNTDTGDSSGSSSDSSDSDKGADSNQANVEPIDIELKDQNGNPINIKNDFKGKVVFINFFATWCPPCKKEIPDIQKIYEEKGYNKKDIVILGVVAPSQGREMDIDGVKQFIKDNGITYNVLMDNDGKVFGKYGIYSLPTTIFVDKDGNIYGHIAGMMTKEIMESALQEVVTAKPNN